MPAEPVTREAFAALVQDLRGELPKVDEARYASFFTVPRHAVPAAWRGRPWARDYAGAATLIELTGYTKKTLVSNDYLARVARERGELTVADSGGRRRLRRLMPESRKVDGRREWVIGEIALWVAVRDDRQAAAKIRDGHRDELISKVHAIYERDGRITAAGVTRELGLGVDGHFAMQLIWEAGLKSAGARADAASREQITAAVREAVTKHGAGASIPNVTRILVAAGVRARPARIRPILNRARLERIQAAMIPGPEALEAPLESLRADGLVITVQVARAYGIDPGAVSNAKNRGVIRVAGWEPYAGGSRPLYDPARLWVRADGGTGPVDKDHKLAAKIDLD